MTLVITLKLTGTHILGTPHIMHATFCEVSRTNHEKNMKNLWQEPSCDASALVVGP
jgi:hypothetical protein